LRSAADLNVIEKGERHCWKLSDIS